MIIKRIFNFVKGARGLDLIKTIYFNLRYFPLHEAICLPVFIKWNVEIRNMRRGNIVFADGARFFTLGIGFIDREYTFNKPSLLNLQGTLILKGRGYHSFAPGCILYIGQNATMEIGNNFSVSHDSKFYIRKHLIIGDNNMWSYYNVIMDNDAHPMLDNEGNLLNNNENVLIGNNVWMGCRCTILKGGSIPNGSIIGSNSMVNKCLAEDNCVYAVNPIRLIRHEITWKTNLL
jgi:acetyltransferase-like isoleucine patch superfamily enzyme